jgi:uncharacterized protein YciI
MVTVSCNIADRSSSKGDIGMSDQGHPWAEKVRDIRSKGVLGMQLYVILTRPAAGMDAVLENMGAHLAYQKELEATGVMFAAGPFANEDETLWQGAGMVIVRAGSVELAREIAAADPMHSSGARDFTIHPWLLNEGSLTFRVTYSDGKREIS